MRIALVNKYYYPPHLGGIETYVRSLAEEVVSRPGMSVEAIVSNEDSSTVREVIGGVEVLRLARLFAASSTPVAPAMPDAIRAAARQGDRADVFHLQFPYPWGDWAWQRAGSPGPAVVSYHSDIVRQRFLGSLYRPIMRRMLARADLIIAATPPMVEHSPELRRHADKCRIVPYGIHPERYEATPARRARADALRGAHDRPVVLFVGRLVYYKGAEVLVRAMATVDADAVLIGSGPLEPTLRELAVALGVSDRLTFLPPVDDEELTAWLMAADVFCLPSVATSEAFGIVQLEAHACGTPVVCTDLPTGVPWVNRDGETGLVVPPGDADALATALARLTSDTTLRDEMGARAKERVLERFTVKRMVDSTLDVYEEALARTHR